MNGAKTARVARLGLRKTERRRRRPGQRQSPAFTLNSGNCRRWRLERGESVTASTDEHILIFLTHRFNNTCSLVLAQVGLKNSGPEPEQKK